MTADRNNILVQFLTEKGGQFEHEQLTGFTSGSALTSKEAPALSVLDQRALLTLSGPDTAKFLQGQLTSNVELLSDNQHQNGAACTPKGRMYTSYTLLHSAEDTFLIAMHAGLTEPTQKTFEKYAVFFKCDIKEDQNIICLGLSGQDIEDEIITQFGQLPKSGSAIPVSGGGWLLKTEGIRSRFELWIPAENLENWWNKLSSHFTPVTNKHWRLLDCESVTPSLRPEAQEKYIPQHLNLPSLKSVSFRKGCYTGQEIVARMQNLGQLKSRCYRLTSEQVLDLPAGTKLFNSKGKGIGETLDCVVSEAGTDCLAVIRVDAAEDNSVYLEPEGIQRLQAHPLPYIIDTKAELQY